MRTRAIEKAAAVLLFAGAVLGLVGFFSLPGILQIADAQARSSAASLILKRAQRLTDQEEEIRGNIRRLNQALEGMPGWSQTTIDILIAAEVTKIITTLFERNNARLRSSQFLTPADNDGRLNTRIQFVGEVSQGTLPDLLFELEFGDAPVVVEQAIIRGLRRQQVSFGATTQRQIASRSTDVTLEVTIAWHSFQK